MSCSQVSDGSFLQHLLLSTIHTRWNSPQRTLLMITWNKFQPLSTWGRQRELLWATLVWQSALHWVGVINPGLQSKFTKPYISACLPSNFWKIFEQISSKVNSFQMAEWLADLQLASLLPARPRCFPSSHHARVLQVSFCFVSDSSHQLLLSW